MPTQILDRKCRECGASPAEYEEYRHGFHRHVCVKCRAAYFAHWREGRSDYKPRAPQSVRTKPALVKRCQKCLDVKPVDEFYYSVSATDRRQSHCKKCRDAKRNERYLATPKTDASRALQRDRNEKQRIKAAPFKEMVLQHYGPGCFCCGETDVGFLTIDHKNNDGGEKRRQNRGWTGALKYKEIVNAGFPDDLQLACYNCNSGRARTPDKICPHETQRTGLLKLAA